jgi:hypothetical protein
VTIRGIEAMVIDPPRDNVLDRGAAAAIRNVRDLEPGRGIQERAGKVRRRSRDVVE